MSGGKFIIPEMQERVREQALSLVVIGQAVPRNMSKAERAAAILEPRYDASTILHYKGGIIGELEVQIKTARPKFDDIRDALGTAVQNAKKPINRQPVRAPIAQTNTRIMGAARFGGRRV